MDLKLLIQKEQGDVFYTSSESCSVQVGRFSCVIDIHGLLDLAG
jgi:hypothetical protein